MKPKTPNGYATNGLIFFGESLSKETYLSKGMQLEVPDMRTADTGTLLELRRQNNLLLGFLGDQYALQTHWVVEDDYYAPLKRYLGRTEKSEDQGRSTRWASLTRRGRHIDLKLGMDRGELRRERVYLYFGRKCDTLQSADLTSLGSYERFLSQEARNFDGKLRHIQDIYNFSRVTMMDDRSHGLHWRKFLNPSLAQYWAGDPAVTMADFDPAKSLLENCSPGDGIPFKVGREAGVALKLDHYYHTLFVMRRLPRGTRIGLLNPLLGAETRGYCITQNIYPLDLEEEIKLTEDQRAELLKYVNDPKHYGVRDDIRRKEGKITSLLMGQTLPFHMLMVIRAWAPSLEELQAKCVSIKTALRSLEGSEFHHVDVRAQARHLFYETYPGWLGGRYRKWDRYIENKNLRDLLPFSSTFTGHLEEADALYETPSGGVAGIRLSSGDTPQHAALVGMRGSGKTAFLIDLLSQTDDDNAFTAIFEEGLAYGTYAQMRGMQSVVLRPDSDYTSNPFDTYGMPWTDQNKREVVAICMKLVGHSSDEDKNKRREAVIGEYVSKLIATHAKQWKNADEGRFFRLCQRAVATERYRKSTMPQGATFLEGYAELADLERTRADFVQDIISKVSEEDAVMFANQRESADVVRNMTVSQFKQEECPQYTGLWSLIKNGRLPHHRTAAMTEELDYLVSLLAKGRRVGGTVGRLIDGTDNVRFSNAGIHVEYGYLEDGSELKEIAGFLFPTRIRQYIITRPRAERKRVLLEELRRFLLIPNAREIVKEYYAQFRKFNAWVLSIFQQPSQIDEIDPELLELILNNSTQYFLMRQNSEKQVNRLGDVIGLPKAAREPILNYPLAEHQRGSKKASYFTLFSKEGGVPVCGTIKVAVNPYMLYVASSNGATFDERTKTLARYKDTYEGVVAEVNKKIDAGKESTRAAVA